MPNDSILDRLAAEALALALTDDTLFDAILRGALDGKTVTFQRYEDTMPKRDITTDDIREVAAELHAGTIHFESDRFLIRIPDHHLATAETRRALWLRMERLMELEEEFARQG